MARERTEQEWLDSVRLHMLRGDAASARAVVREALAAHPRSRDLRRVQAGILQQSGRRAEAEASLQELAREDPADAASAFALARLLTDQGRNAAAAAVMSACFGSHGGRRDADLAIHAIELLDDCGRKQAAAAIAAVALADHPDDQRLHAYAGMLQMQLGDFGRAREHYLSVMRHSEKGWEWHAAIGLAHTRRYTDADDPDLALFRAGLQRGNLPELARAELWYAIGKADDDLALYEQAAREFRSGNEIARSFARWSSETWKREIAGRPVAMRIPETTALRPDFIPVFIVGMPRSGTTLLADLLSRNPSVCNRGELPWIDRLVRTMGLAVGVGGSRQALAEAAAAYEMQCRQDDGGDARWFIDKQPLNFRYIGLLLAMFPHARIICCHRNPRDTALSLWTHLFADETLGFTHDFATIATVMHDCRTLMARACGEHPSSIREVRYEDLVADPGRTLDELGGWLDLPEATVRHPGQPSAVSTSSLWQVRQPVYQTSVGRWRHYAPYLPELEDFPEA
ncbi:MAG: sulfotransferase [Xanthomonadaceae bacterium]|nr:sulfotransferase [Xanthomonadaceae bacterium]